ncbi:MAG: putative terminase large subunit [Prokaryotic dsDNA virus sp.]|nr:MAG: putative terminase large subunit [Prokaryotic dsDNA virus sp.]|tara:strand:+ start:21297 stop:22157 length:861 start_codon:yes stop_codon:yes gene_type:complete
MMSSEELELTEQWSFNEKRMLRYMLLNDGLQFMRYFFKLREGNKMILNWHHYVIEYVLQAVYDGKISRLIVNIAPGYTKTEQVVLNFISRGLAINPRSKFIHTSYSGDLAQENSSKIKEMVESQEFQDLFPMRTRADKKGKKRWFTEVGGGMMATSSGGQITGFRAGRMEDGFTGAFVNDDPVKPDDAYSQVKRSAINNRFNNTMRSRLAVEEIPMINIMQRIHEDDLTGYLLRGGSGDKWHHLVIPTHLSEEVLTEKYPEDYTHGIPIDMNGILKALHGGPEYDF